MSTKTWLRGLGTVVAAMWIFGGALFFFLRFSFVFYSENKTAIDGAFQRVSAYFGASS